MFVYLDHNFTTTVHEESVQFDLRDKKGREIGSHLTIDQVRYVATDCKGGYNRPGIVPGRVYYFVYIGATRDGKHFGAGGPATLCHSLHEALAAGRRKIEQSRTRYEKKVERGSV